MSRLKSARPTPALIVALVALVAAMSGAAIALPGKATVSTNDVKKKAITKKLIADGAVGSKQIIGKSIKGNRLKDQAVKAKQIADATVTAKQIADGTITKQQVAADGLDSSNISDYTVIRSAAGGLVTATATNGATPAAAETAAPEIPLYAKGQLDVYAKCFRDTTGAGDVFGQIYIRTSANGALTEGTFDLPGQPGTTLLNTSTLEPARVWDSEDVAVANSASYDEAEEAATAPDGTDLHAITHIGVKQGTLPGGDGVFGAGNVCLFGGAITG